MADDPIEDLFRQRLQHHEEAPPANGWQRIHHTLQQPQKKPFAFWRWLSLALLPVATTVLVVKNLPDSTITGKAEPAASVTGTNSAASAATTMPASGKAAARTNAGQPVAANVQTYSSTATQHPDAQAGATPDLNTAETTANNSAANVAGGTNTAGSTAGSTSRATYNLTESTRGATAILPAGNQTASTRSKIRNNSFAAANRSENGLAPADAKTGKRTAATERAAAAKPSLAPESNRQTQLALAQQNQASLAADNTQPAQKEEETDEAAAPTTGNATAANPAKTGNALPKNPAGGAPAGSGGAASAHATVPKVPAAGAGTGYTGNTGNPNPPAVADSLIETEAKNSERLLATAILVDPLLAETKVPGKNLEPTTQPDENENRETAGSDNRHWHFGANLGTRYGLRRFAPSTTDEVHIQQLSDKNKTYPARLDYEAGALAQRQLTNKLALEAGLGVLYFREQVTFKAATAPTAPASLTQTNNHIEYLPNYRYQTVQNNTTAWYATTRFGAVYNALGSGQTRLQLTGGLTANYLVSEKTTSNAAELGLARPEPARLQAGAYAGLRLMQKFPSGAAVALEPGFTYYATPWQKQVAPYALRSHAATVNFIFFLK